MNMVALVGSMKKDGTTNYFVSKVLEEAKKIDSSIKHEIIYVSDLNIECCGVICSAYCSNNPYHCTAQDDLKLILDKIKASDALIFGAPLYVKSPPARTTALIEKLVTLAYFSESKGTKVEHPLNNKPCGLVGTTEYDDPLCVLEFLHNFVVNLRMTPLILKNYPFLGVGANGNKQNDKLFDPLERSKELAQLLVEKNI